MVGARVALALFFGSAEGISQQWRAVHERRRLVAPISEQAQSRRTLERFTRGHPDNSICWDRDGVDGFINVIDAHQHPVPFGGPEVPFSLYTDWFIQHGTVFSVFMGIGQRITKQNASAPDCCYYLHCPTFDYPVIPKVESDEINAIAKLEHYYGKVDHRLHLITAATFPNLQRSAGALEDLKGLWKKFPKTFKWLGEINVFKHALAGNAFFSDFTGPRLTVARVESGELDALFSVIGPEQPNGEHMPAATLHSDMGCDTYTFPKGSGDGVHPLVCEASEEEKRVAQKDYLWWKATLGEFYSGFFDEANYPKSNFRKIMHIHVTDSIISRYKEVKFVWAHVGLCMELTQLHPAVHAKIIESFFERHATNLWLDTSWDVLAKQNFVNYDGKPIEETFSAWASEDLTDDGLFDMPHWTRERERLDKIWQAKKDLIKSTVTTLTGPSYKMAVLLDLMQRYPDKFIPGTDYVASFGVHDDFPGYTPIDGSPLSPTHVIEGAGDRPDPHASPHAKSYDRYGYDRGGCHKTEMTHSEQITDTSSLNMFYNDELFTQMVLGSNFFRVAGLETKFAPPPLCRHDPDKPSATVTEGWKPNVAITTPTIMEGAPQPPQPNMFTVVPTWNASAFFVAVGCVSGLVVALAYLAGVRHGGKSADKEAAPYHLQSGSAPLLADA